MRIVSLLLVCVIGIGVPIDSSAQELPATNIVKEFVMDQSRLWQAPLKVSRGEAKWLAPLGAGALALLATDQSMNRRLGGENLGRPSRYAGMAGAPGPLLTLSAGILLTGRIAGNTRTSRTGQRALTALAHTELVVRSLKLISDRERPNKPEGSGQFWGGGRSFPSAHAADSWAFATVIADEFQDKRLVGIAAYSLASVVTVSRISGRHHFPSDTLIGASIGRLIGRYLVKKHRENAPYLR